MKKQSKGITLITLIITIVILLILAGICIQLITNTGIFENAKKAKEETNKSQATEKINLKIATAQMNNYAEKQKLLTLQELANFLEGDEEIAYVHTSKGMYGSIANVNIGSATSIYTKLKQYPYEFEINDSLQLASIDGNKVSNDSSGNSNGSNSESSLISSIDFQISNITGSSFDVTISTKQQNSDSVAGYYVFCNNKIVRVSEANEIQITNLEKNTKYKIKCVALDINGNIKISSEREIQTVNITLNDVTALEYPKLTAIGFKNCKDNAGNLYYLEGITNTGDHAATYQAFDGLNEEFYVDDHMIFDIDESFRGKVIKLIGYKNLSLVHVYNSSLQKTTLGYVFDKKITIPEYACRVELETQSGRAGYIQEIEFE